MKSRNFLKVPPHLITQYQEAMAAQQRSQLAQRQQAAGMSPLDIQEQMIAEQQRLQAVINFLHLPISFFCQKLHDLNYF